MKCLASLTFSILFVALTGLTSLAQSGTEKYDDPRLGQRVRLGPSGSWTTSEALLQVMRSGKVPGGIVLQEECSPPHSLGTLPIHEATVAEAIDAILRKDRTLRWSFDRGTVSVEPVRKRASLLDVKLKSGKIKAPNLEAAIDFLFQREEVRAAATKLGLDRGFDRGPGMQAIPRPGAIAQARDATIVTDGLILRQALLNLVRSQGSAVWVYTEKRCHARALYSIELVAK